jgi:hypothetical protein
VVASIEETAERYEIPKTFIGLILIPFVVSISSLFLEGATHLSCEDKCGRECYIHANGQEGSYGTRNWHLHGQFHCTSTIFFSFLLLTPDVGHCKANCDFRHTPPSRDWLDVSNAAQNSGLVS